MGYHSKFSRFALEFTLEYYEIQNSRFALEHRYLMLVLNYALKLVIRTVSVIAEVVVASK